MSDTLGNLRDALRERLDEDFPRAWMNSHLERWIYDAAKDMARRTECLEASADLAVSAGTQLVSTSTLITLLRVKKVEFIEDGGSSIYPLEYRDFTSMDSVWWNSQATTNSRPGFWTTKGNPPALSIMLYPIPPSDGTLRVTYYHLPAAPTTANGDASVIECPTGWEDLIVDFAEYRALRKDADPRWKEAFDLYKDNLAAMKDLTIRYTDQANVMGMDPPRLDQWVWDDTWAG